MSAKIRALPCTTTGLQAKLLFQPESTDDQDIFKPTKQSAHHFYKLSKIHLKESRLSVPLFRCSILLTMLLITHSNAQTCFDVSDKLPSFIIDVAELNDYVWQTVIISKDDRYLYKGGYVEIFSSAQTAFTGAPVGKTLALAGLFDTQTNTFIWVKVFQDQNISSPIISALALNYAEDTLVLAGTSTDARQSFYFFVNPTNGTEKYPSFTVQHDKDFHFLTSQSILLAGASRLYCSGISMQFSAQYTIECANIGQTCGGTDNQASLDAIQYLVVDYANQTVLWHKIANSTAHFGAGQLACLIDVNPTASVNGNEHVIMGGGYSPVVPGNMTLWGNMTQWTASLMSINPTDGSLDLIQGLQHISSTYCCYYTFTAPTKSNYPLIVHMDLYQTAAQWSIFTMSQSRDMINGGGNSRTYFCQIDFNDANYTTVNTTNCINYSDAYGWRSYGMGIKYDPNNNKIHFITHSSDISDTQSDHRYYKVSMAALSGTQFNNIYWYQFSNAGVFTKKPLTTMTDGFQIFPGYFVGRQKNLRNNFPYAPGPADITFANNAAVTFPYNKYQTCSNELNYVAIYGVTTPGQLTNTLSTQSNLIVGDQQNLVVVLRSYNTTDLQFSSLVTNYLCNTRLRMNIGQYKLFNLYNDTTTTYECPIILNTLNDTCTDSNLLIHSIDESAITNNNISIFSVNATKSTILMQIQDQNVPSQQQNIFLTSTTPFGLTQTFYWGVKISCGPAPVGFDPCTAPYQNPYCQIAINPISVVKSEAPLNVDYLLGSTVNKNATFLPFNLTDSCAYCSTSHILYSMIVVPFQVSQSSSFILFYNGSPKMVSWYTTNALNVGEFNITIKGAIGRAIEVNDTFTFKLTITIPICSESQDYMTIIQPTLSNQSYIWTQPAGSYQIPLFSVSSTLSICNTTDIVYTMLATGSIGGSTTFITFNSTSMLVNWFDSTLRVAETFTIALTSTISNNNTSSPFIKSKSFQLVIKPPTCVQSLDVPTITTPNLSNKTYIWTQSAGYYQIPLFSVSSTLSICNASDIIYTILATGSIGGSTTFITYNSTSMLFQWFDSFIRVAETFTISFNATITNLNIGSPFSCSTMFRLVVTPPTCAQSLDIATILSPTLSNQTYIWTQPAGSYQIPLFSVSSTLSICNASDIVYTMSVTASSGGSTTFLKFDSSKMLVSWFESINRVNETFKLTFGATIISLNAGSPFKTTQFLQLVVQTQPTCAQSLDVPTITSPTLSNKSYIWTQPAGQYSIPLFSVSSTLSICNASDIVYTMSVTASSDGDTQFITFNSPTMLIQWFESNNRFEETFTIILHASISNLNTNPFIAEKSFQLVVHPPQNLIYQTQKSANNQTSDYNKKQSTKIIKPETIEQQNSKIYEQPIYPVWQKIKITNQGQVKIYFSERLIIPSNWTNISQGNMILKIIPSNFDRMNYLNFTWKMLSFTNDYFEIQLLFQDPLQISRQRKSLEKLKILCQDDCVGFFISQKTRLSIESPQIIQYPIPAQLSKNKAANKALTSFVSTAQTTSSTCMSSSFVVSLILNLSLAKVWAMMNALQIIGKLPKFNSYTPANVNALFGFIENISSFKIIPTDSIVNAIMGKKEIEIFQELGPMFLVLILFFVLLIFWILSYMLRNLCRPFKCIYNWTTQFLFWNQTLRYIVEGYLDLSLNSLILLSSNLNWSTWQEKFASTFAIITVFLCTFVPCFITIYLSKNIQKFQDPEFKLKFKEIIDNLNEKNKYCSSQIFTFCYHRLILVLLIVFVDKFPYLQTIVMTITCLVVMASMFGLGQTMQLAIDQKLEYFNQIIILIVVYHMFSFTDFVDNAETRYIMGYSMCFFACFDVFANLIVIFLVIVKEISCAWKRYRQKNRRAKYLVKKRLEIKLERQKLTDLKNDCKRERALQVFRLLFPIQDNNFNGDLYNRDLKLAIVKEDIVGEESQESQKRVTSNKKSQKLSLDQDFTQKKVFDAGPSSVWEKLILDLEVQEIYAQMRNNREIIDAIKEKPSWKGAQKPIPIPRMIEDIREEQLAQQKAEKYHLQLQTQQQVERAINNQLLPVKESNIFNITLTNIVKTQNELFDKDDGFYKNFRILDPHNDFIPDRQVQKIENHPQIKLELTKQEKFEAYIQELIQQERFSEIERMTDNEIITEKLDQKIQIAKLLAGQRQRQEASQLQNFGYIF